MKHDCCMKVWCALGFTLGNYVSAKIRLFSRFLALVTLLQIKLTYSSKMDWKNCCHYGVF